MADEAATVKNVGLNAGLFLVFLVAGFIGGIPLAQYLLQFTGWITGSMAIIMAASVVVGALFLIPVFLAVVKWGDRFKWGLAGVILGIFVSTLVAGVSFSAAAGITASDDAWLFLAIGVPVACVAAYYVVRHIKQGRKGKGRNPKRRRSRG